MAPPLRLDPHGAKLFEDWARRAPDADVELVSVLLERVSDGSWKARWHTEPDSGDAKVTVISPREGLLVSVRFETGDPGLFDVEYIGPRPGEWP